MFIPPSPFIIQWTVQLIVLNLAVYQQIHHLNTLTDCGPQSQWSLSFCVSWLLYMPVIYPFHNIPIRTFQTETRAWDFKSYINIILPFSVYPLRSWHLLICSVFMRGLNRVIWGGKCWCHSFWALWRMRGEDSVIDADEKRWRRVEGGTGCRSNRWGRTGKPRL